MHRRLAVGLVLLALVAAPLASAAPLTGASAAGTGAGAGAAGAASGPTALAAQQQFDQTTFEITVFENGSARWTFRYTRQLENQSARESFEAYAREFEQNETELYTNFRQRASALTAQGTNVTDRQMNATAFSRHADIVRGPNDRGVVQMSFLWTNFARTEGNRVVVGDVFEGGLYLGPNQRLVVRRGPNLTFSGEDATIRPDPDSFSGGTIPESDTITWRGEQQFSDNRPYVALVPRGSGGPAGPGGGSNAVAMVAVALVVLLGVGAAVAWRTGALDGLRGGAATEAPEQDTGPGVGVDDAAASGAGAAATVPTGEVEGEPAVPDEELLSDEDRVVSLLEENGGRMKQVDIVDETGWSKSKVSMLLSDMEDEDLISKLRVGRENVISLKGHEPDAAKSPFEERD